MNHPLLVAALLFVAALSTVHAEDTPLTFADPSARRYELSARASVIDPRARPHPEIDFVFEKDGKPQDVENASVDTRVRRWASSSSGSWETARNSSSA